MRESSSTARGDVGSRLGSNMASNRAIFESGICAANGLRPYRPGWQSQFRGPNVAYARLALKYEYLDRYGRIVIITKILGQK
jgi:hypothetical protein